MAGDEAHIPKQYTGSRVTAPLAVVLCEAQPKVFSAKAMSASAPQAWQASARHTCTTCLPGALLRLAVSVQDTLVLSEEGGTS
jgi:hypothetical protein